MGAIATVSDHDGMEMQLVTGGLLLRITFVHAQIWTKILSDIHRHETDGWQTIYFSWG